MKLAPIALRLRQIATSFDDRVFGAAEFANAMNESYDSPTAFVIEMASSAQPPTDSYSWTSQLLTEAFSVLVMVSNVSDPHGHTAHEALYDIRAEIWKAILGWKPDSRYLGINPETPIYFLGSNLHAIDRARLWWRFDFAIQFMLQDNEKVEPATFDDFDYLWTEGLFDPSDSELSDVSGLSLPIGSTVLDRTLTEDEIDYTV